MADRTGIQANDERGWYLRIDIDPDGHDILQFQRNGGGINWFNDDAASVSQRSSNVPVDVHASAVTERYTNVGLRSELLGRELQPVRRSTNASTNAGQSREDTEAAKALSSLGQVGSDIDERGQARTADCLVQQSSLPKPHSTVHSLMFDRALLVAGQNAKAAKSTTKAGAKTPKQGRGLKATGQSNLENSSAQATDLRSGQPSSSTGKTQRRGWYYKAVTSEEESSFAGAFRTSLTDEHARVTRSVLRQTKANESPAGTSQPPKSTPVKRGHGERASLTAIEASRVVISSPDPEDRASNPRIEQGNLQSHNKAKLGPARLFPKLKLRFTGNKSQAEKSAEDHVDNGQGQAAGDNVTVSSEKPEAEEQYGEMGEDQNSASDFGDEEFAGIANRGEDSWTRTRDDGRDLDVDDGELDRMDEGEDHAEDNDQPQQESGTQHSGLSGLAGLMLQRHRTK